MESEKDLFDIRINETGTRYILKVYKLSGLILILFLMVSLMSLFMSVTETISTFELSSNKKFTFLKASSILAVLTTAFNIAGYIYYITFIKTIHKSISTSDQELFNSSFKFIYKNLVIFLVIFAIDIVIYGIHWFIRFD